MAYSPGAGGGGGPGGQDPPPLFFGGGGGPVNFIKRENVARMHMKTLHFST